MYCFKDGIGHNACVSQTLAVGQEYLNGKLVAVAEGEEPHLQSRNDKEREPRPYSADIAAKLLKKKYGNKVKRLK